MAGVFSKMKSKYNNVSDNKVYENGKDVGGNTNYMGGGIRLECIYTNNWTVEHNNITNNLGPGIFVRGKYNNISHNNVVGNKNASSRATGTGVGAGYGIFFHSVGNHNNITANRFCYNEYYDVYNNSDATGTTGDDNTCDGTSNYNDDGTTGCTYRCMHAYRPEVANKPPNTNNVPNTEFTDAQYDNIEWDDGTNQYDYSDSCYAAHRFNFSVIWDPSDVNKINVTWNGRGYNNAGNGAQLYIWNGTAYEQPPLATTNSGDWVYLTGEKTSSISDYINGGNVTVLVVQNTSGSISRSRIRTDYVRFKLEVTPDP